MKLDKDRILELLAEADTKWFKNHSSKYSYREHLDFTADYIAKHYEKKSANQNRGKGNGATGKETNNLRASF